MDWVLLGSAISIKIVFCTFPVPYKEFVVEIHYLGDWFAEATF